MNVKLIRMWSGEDVIADLLDDGPDTITIMNPLVTVPQPSGMSFAPWSPLLKEKNMDITLKQSYVVMITETQPEVEDFYKEQFSVIKAPSKKLIV